MPTIRVVMPNGTTRPFREGTPRRVIEQARADMLADMRESDDDHRAYRAARKVTVTANSPEKNDTVEARAAKGPLPMTMTLGAFGMPGTDGAVGGPTLQELEDERRRKMEEAAGGLYAPRPYVQAQQAQARLKAQPENIIVASRSTRKPPPPPPTELELAKIYASARMLPLETARQMVAKMSPEARDVIAQTRFADANALKQAEGPVETRAYHPIPKWHREGNMVQVPQDGPFGLPYKTYGTPTNGAGQWADPRMEDFLNAWLAKMQEIGIKAPPELGNISLKGGGPFWLPGKSEPDHATHQRGREMDVRPAWLTEIAGGRDYRNKGYNQETTRKMIEAAMATGMVKRIIFNDPSIEGTVKGVKKHNDHFHIELDDCRQLYFCARPSVPPESCHNFGYSCRCRVQRGNVRMSRKMFVYGVLAGFALCGTVSFAVAQADEPEVGNVRGHWELFGGWKTDEYHEPKTGDAKLVVTVDGAVGQKIFNYLGPKSADAGACGGLNVRSRNEVECLRIPEWKTIQCYFGFDLSTGRYEVPINC